MCVFALRNPADGLFNLLCYPRSNKAKPQNPTPTEHLCQSGWVPLCGSRLEYSWPRHRRPSHTTPGTKDHLAQPRNTLALPSISKLEASALSTSAAWPNLGLSSSWKTPQNTIPNGDSPANSDDSLQNFRRIGLPIVSKLGASSNSNVRCSSNFSSAGPPDAHPGHRLCIACAMPHLKGRGVIAVMIPCLRKNTEGGRS